MKHKKLDYNEVIEYHLQHGQRCKKCVNGIAKPKEVTVLNTYRQVTFICDRCLHKQTTLYNVLSYLSACSALNIDSHTLKPL